MTPRLTKAEYIGEYKIELTFEDGTFGVIDLDGDLWGEVFEPLKDLNNFRAFKIDPELQTIVWPTGADLAPEFLYQRVAA